jgi:hypothetical protein
MTPEFKDVQLLGVRTVSSMPKAKPPATLMEIKAGLIGSIRAAARKIDKLLQTEYKPSHTWLSVRTDSKRHVLKFVVSGSDEHLRHAHDLAKVVEQWISEEYSQQVPVEVSEPPRYVVTSGGASAHVYRGETAPSKVQEQEDYDFF